MKQRSILRLFLALGTMLLLRAQAGEYQVRTADGQTLQGEYLGTEDGVVKLRTKYGVQQIPFKDVLAMTQVVAAPKPAPAEQPADKEPAAEQPAEQAARLSLRRLLGLLQLRLRLRLRPCRCPACEVWPQHRACGVGYA